MDDYLSKPIRPADMIAALERAGGHENNRLPAAEARVPDAGGREPSASPAPEEQPADSPTAGDELPVVRSNGAGSKPAQADPARAPGAPEQAGAEEPAVDESTLRRLREGTDAEFVAELIGDFFGEAQELLEQMRRAIAEGRPEELWRAGHTLKSTSATLGAMRLAAACRHLEDLGKAVFETAAADGRIGGDAPAWLNRAEAEFERARLQLEAAREVR
jgi:HPt (histidine-containing phosphotransfer) domain-containing protein